jgi:long-subunit acyl-CoA synthetase (AMP-forming)
MKLFDRILEHACSRPRALALRGKGIDLDYLGLVVELYRLALKLRKLRINTLGLDMDNGPIWVLFDLAAASMGITLVPIPPFFSNQQVQHCLQQAGVQAVISDNPELFKSRAVDAVADSWDQLTVMQHNVALINAFGDGDSVPSQVAKVTFTSGTTGEPKGVMLPWERIEAVVESLATTVEVRKGDHHLALMPLSVLLENIAGLYVSLWVGATAVVPPLAETGLKGAAGLDAATMLQAMQHSNATSVIMTPQTLQSMVELIENGSAYPGQLRFIAVGGATVSLKLLARARRLGLPVFEGYGLSECASVTTLNSSCHYKMGSVGRPLPHTQLRIADDGEVLVSGNLFAGYLGEAAPQLEDGWWHTGDIGHLDEDGFLYLKGRRRNIFITAYGRNVSPEWIERELVLEKPILQAALFGEARPWNVAVIVAMPGTAAGDLAASIARVNSALPDYARVTRWISADEPFTPINGQLSGTGRIRRQDIYQIYQHQIELLYQEELVS